MNTHTPNAHSAHPSTTRRLLRAAALLTCSGLFLCASALASPAEAYADDRPGFNGAYQSGNKVIFRFTLIDNGWDYYNVRYAAAGGGTKQVENRSGTFTFNNVKPNRVYTISVQGCNKHTFGRSTCSPWSSKSVTTR
jgi:hypothetical protein